MSTYTLKKAGIRYSLLLLLVKTKSAKIRVMDACYKCVLWMWL